MSKLDEAYIEKFQKKGERMKDELILKVVAWRIISILMTLIVLYTITGDTQETTWVTILLHTLFTIGHYMFELAWGKFFKIGVDDD